MHLNISIKLLYRSIHILTTGDKFRSEEVDNQTQYDILKIKTEAKWKLFDASKFLLLPAREEIQ